MGSIGERPGNVPQKQIMDKKIHGQSLAFGPQNHKKSGRKWLTEEWISVINVNGIVPFIAK